MKKDLSDIPIQDICERVRTLRDGILKLDTSSICSLLSINYTTYMTYENNRIPPSDVLYKIKKLFPDKVDLNWLILGKEGRGDEKQKEGVFMGVHEDLLRDLLRRVQKLEDMCQQFLAEKDFKKNSPEKPGEGEKKKTG